MKSSANSSAFLKKSIECQKAAFDAGYNTMVILQGHAEKMTGNILEQVKLPAGNQYEALTETLETYKQSRDEFKKIVDESFSRAESLFS